MGHIRNSLYCGLLSVFFLMGCSKTQFQALPGAGTASSRLEVDDGMIPNVPEIPGRNPDFRCGGVTIPMTIGTPTEGGRRVTISNFRFCRKQEHNEETTVYSFNEDTEVFKPMAVIAVVPAGVHSSNEDSFQGNSGYNKLMTALNHPSAVKTSVAKTSTASGSARYAALENASMSVNLTASEVNALMARYQSECGELGVFIVDDRNNDGKVSPGDRFVSENEGFKRPIAVSSAKAAGFSSSSNYDLQMETKLFNGAGNKECEGIEDSELAAICREQCDEFASPLAIDLGRDGFNLTSAADGVNFDVDNEGVVGRVAWFEAQGDDALVGLDLNGNGRLDNGGELFGTGTYLSDGRKASNGYQALAQYDQNFDGQIDARDAVYSSLVLWVDANHNGVSEYFELSYLSRSVASLGLRYNIVRSFDEFGNAIFADSFAYLKNGSIRSLADLWFAKE